MKSFLDHSFRKAVWLLCATACSGFAQTNFWQSPPVPAFAGTNFPVAPRQQASWAFPQGAISTNWVSAVASLFTAGLADPCGLEYREIELVAGRIEVGSGAGQVIKTHAWVLPVAAGQTQRFAVCWSGVVYPVLNVGPVCDLGADVRALVQIATESQGSGRRRLYGPGYAIPEESGVSHKTLLPIKACLLLRLGQEEPARAIAKAFEQTLSQSGQDPDEGDPFLMLAGDWAWTLWDRALCAHIRGDDHLALATLRFLNSRIGTLEAEAEKRGFERPMMENNYGSNFGERKPTPYHWSFLTAMPLLLADQERRATFPIKQQSVPEGLSQSNRIAFLIDALDQVDAPQMSQPGGVDLRMDWRVQALIKEGTPAVAPLIQCIESDHRLVRSVSFHRDFFRRRYLHKVAEAAYMAVVAITGNSFVDQGSTADDLLNHVPEGQQMLANSIRAQWKQFAGKSKEEQWCLILADDRAIGQWLEAARRIVQPQEEAMMKQAFYSGQIPAQPEKRESGQPRALVGESLRSKVNPSVTELMAKRVSDLSQAGAPPAGLEPSAVEAGAELALLLAQWDRTNGLSALQAQSKRCLDTMVMLQPSLSGYAANLGRYLALLTVQRGLAGDMAALDQYAAWLRSHDFEHRQAYGDSLMKPLAQFPTHPAMAALTEWVFNDPQSPWLPYSDLKDRKPGLDVYKLLGSPLAFAPGFQKLIFRNLADRANVGEVKIEDHGLVHMSYQNGSGAYQSNPGDPLLPATGTVQPLRHCDYVARHLRNFSMLPKFEPYWPEDKRDAAIRAIVKALQELAGHPPALPYEQEEDR